MAELHQDYKSFWRTTPVLILRLLRALHPQTPKQEREQPRSLSAFLAGGGGA